jgi:FixJ family two-component response regulator
MPGIDRPIDVTALSPYEEAFLAAIAEHKTTPAAARALGISAKTGSRRAEVIRQKLFVATTKEAVEAWQALRSPKDARAAG